MFVKRQMGNPNWYFTHEQQRYTPPDVSAIVLAKLKKDAEAYLGRPLPYAVITVPAYFGDDPRRATISAGEAAGFKVLDLVNEPTAAAVAFGVDRSCQDETVLVYDLGGGTFDVTIMRVAGKDIKVIATDGDHQLGGKDFDDALMRFAVDRFKSEYGFDPTLDPIVAGELRVNAEKAKRELSKRAKAVLLLRADGKTGRVDIAREQFEALIKPKLDTTMALVRSVLRDAGLQPGKVDRVLLVGGSTRIPAVQSILGEFFGKQPDASVNPDEAVALGAAIKAAHKAIELGLAEAPASIVGKIDGLQITDVTSHSIGIEAFVPGTTQPINSILIPRNTPIPTEVSKEFVTTMPGQTAVQVTVYQGEFQDPKLCNSIGKFTLSGLPPNRPAGRKVRVTVGCGENGVVRVSAVDIETGCTTETRVGYKCDSSAARTSARDHWKRKPIM
jgi:molecular chaperone DnaK